MAPEKETIQKVQKDITEKTREIWLAGLGLLYTAEEEGSRLFKDFMEKGKKLVEKGEEFEKKTKDVTSEKKNELTKRLDEVVNFFEDKFKATLETVGITSKSEVKELTEKVDMLTQKVAELTEKLEKAEKKSSATRA